VIEKADRISRIINIAVDLLLINYPTRTSLGVVLGIVLDFFFSLFYPLISRNEYLDPERISRWQFAAVGVLIVHLPTIRGFLSKQPDFPEPIENAIKVIEGSNLSKEEKRQQYRLLIEKVLESVVLNKDTDAEMKDIQQKLGSKTFAP
jgi:hypothetical protein